MDVAGNGVTEPTGLLSSAITSGLSRNRTGGVLLLTPVPELAAHAKGHP